jgi:hypothetical protein
MLPSVVTVSCFLELLVEVELVRAFTQQEEQKTKEIYWVSNSIAIKIRSGKKM